MTACALYAYFSKRTVKLMSPDEQKQLLCLRRTIIIEAIVCVVAIFVTYVSEIIYINKVPESDPNYADLRQDATYLCHSLGAVTVAVTWTVITTSIACLTRKIEV